MTTDQQINHGVDIERFGAFAEYAANDPLVWLDQDVQISVNTPAEVRADD